MIQLFVVAWLSINIGVILGAWWATRDQHHRWDRNYKPGHSSDFPF